MTLALALIALASRLAFFALAFASLGLSFARKGPSGVKAAFAASAFLMVSSAASTHDPWRLIPLGLTCGLLAVAHFASQRLIEGKDGAAQVMAYIVLLISVGMCLILDVQTGTGASSPSTALTLDQAMASYLPGMLKYTTFAALGLAAFVIAIYIAHHEVSLLSGHFVKWFALGIALLAIVLIIGSEAGGATSWLTLPAGISLQPSEFAKVALVIAAAGYLAANASRLAQFSLRGILPIALAFAVSLASVALQRDLGCALIIFITLTVMMVNSTKNGWVYLLALAIAGAGMVLIAYLGFDHVRTRFEIWQNPLADPYGTGYQYLTATQCLANGGIIGCGLGHGVHFNRMPVAESDYIYAVLCEELGLAGCLVVVGCYVGLAWESARCASQLPRASFERNLVAATGALITCEAALIIGGVVNLIPLTGITLPLVSRGGSSLVASLAALGLMLGASASAKADRPDQARIIAPHFMAGATSLALAACLVSTGASQLGEDGSLRLCGTTMHENLRGSIVTADGIELARDEYLPRPSDNDAEDKHSGEDLILKRVFPHDDLACHLIGMRSSGVEAKVDLKGENPLANLLAIPECGDDLKLTIDFDVQVAAEAELEGQTGAIVVIDPQTGRVIAMASAPTYDLAGDVDEASQSYFNRATLGSYSPGSTFKLVTLASALEHGTADADSSYEAPSSLDFEGKPVTNFRNQGFGTINLAQATNYSANTVFAQVGADLGSEALMSTAEDFGFNGALTFCTGSESSTIAGLNGVFELAWASCGEPQGEAELAASPLQMALCMCAIANEGTIMQPYVIEGRAGKLGLGYDTFEEHVFAEAISPQTAKTIEDILSQNDAASTWCPYEIWGKTGTAEIDGAEDNAWYVCTAKHAGNAVVVACIIEQGGTGAGSALPRAARVAGVALDEMAS